MHSYILAVNWPPAGFPASSCGWLKWGLRPHIILRPLATRLIYIYPASLGKTYPRFAQRTYPRFAWQT